MRHISYLALAGGLILLVATGLYIGLIYAEGDGLAALPWALAMALCGLGAVWMALSSGPRRRHLFLTLGAISLLLGLVAIFSIGLLLIAAGVAILAAAAAEPRPEG